MTSFDSSEISEYRRIAKAATPGPWLDGNWFRFCHRKHEHNFKATGEDACKPEHVFSDGGRLVSAGTPLNPITVIGNEEYQGVAMSAENKRFIVAFNPAVVNRMLEAIEALNVSSNPDSPQQEAKSRYVKSLLKKIISKDELETAAVHEAGRYIDELEQTVRALSAQLAGRHE